MTAPITCLYVDDDPCVRDLVSFNLEAEGIVVHAFESARDIEEAVRRLQPDLIMLDVMMPGRDGYSVLRSLKGCDDTRGIPVVLLSAKASDAEIWDGWQAGADYYLTKPFRVDQLVEYLHVMVASAPTGGSGGDRTGDSGEPLEFR